MGEITPLRVGEVPGSNPGAPMRLPWRAASLAHAKPLTTGGRLWASVGSLAKKAQATNAHPHTVVAWTRADGPGYRPDDCVRRSRSIRTVSISVPRTRTASALNARPGLPREMERWRARASSSAMTRAVPAGAVGEQARAPPGERPQRPEPPAGG